MNLVSDDCLAICACYCCCKKKKTNDVEEEESSRHSKYNDNGNDVEFEDPAMRQSQINLIKQKLEKTQSQSNSVRNLNEKQDGVITPMRSLHEDGHELISDKEASPFADLVTLNEQEEDNHSDSTNNTNNTNNTSNTLKINHQINIENVIDDADDYKKLMVRVRSLENVQSQSNEQTESTDDDDDEPEPEAVINLNNDNDLNKIIQQRAVQRIQSNEQDLNEKEDDENDNNKHNNHNDDDDGIQIEKKISLQITPVANEQNDETDNVWEVDFYRTHQNSTAL